MTRTNLHSQLKLFQAGTSGKGDVANVRDIITLVVTNSFPRPTPLSLLAGPISLSLPYTSAPSM